MSKTVPPTTLVFSNSSADVVTCYYDDATEGSFSMSSRLDIELPNALMFAAYNKQGGVQLAPDTADPYDNLNFPAAQYPYAFETFGNDGSTTRGKTATDASNQSLTDLTTPSAATVYTDLQEAGTGSGSTFVGSDHYPIFGDFNIVVVPTVPVLTAQGFTNGGFSFRLASSTNTVFILQGSTNLTTWSNLGSALTDSNGVAAFVDTNNPGFSDRFYRAYWPYP